jgi:copper(I)-binding protein
MFPRPPRATGLALLLGLAACGSPGDAPLEVPGPEVRGGNAGVDQPVTDHVTVQDVELAFPEDGVWSAGEDAELYLGITNTGTDPVALVGVSGPAFAGVEVDDGALPLRVPAGDTLYVGAEGAPAIVLQDLGTDLRSSESIPVTIAFEGTDDGSAELTVDAVVAAAGQRPQAGADFADPDVDPTEP